MLYTNRIDFAWGPITTGNKCSFKHELWFATNQFYKFKRIFIFTFVLINRIKDNVTRASLKKKKMANDLLTIVSFNVLIYQIFSYFARNLICKLEIKNLSSILYTNFKERNVVRNFWIWIAVVAKCIFRYITY